MTDENRGGTPRTDREDDDLFVITVDVEDETKEYRPMPDESADEFARNMKLAHGKDAVTKQPYGDE